MRTPIVWHMLGAYILQVLGVGWSELFSKTVGGHCRVNMDKKTNVEILRPLASQIAPDAQICFGERERV